MDRDLFADIMIMRSVVKRCDFRDSCDLGEPDFDLYRQAAEALALGNALHADLPIDEAEIEAEKALVLREILTA